MSSAQLHDVDCPSLTPIYTPTFTKGEILERITKEMVDGRFGHSVTYRVLDTDKLAELLAEIMNRLPEEPN